MKKLLALLLAISTLVCLAACSKKDDNDEDWSEFKKDDVVYTQVTLENGDVLSFESIDSETVAITGFSGKDTPHAVTIPATVKTSDDAEAGTKTVAKIASSAFYGVSAIETLNIPDSVVEIDDYAFANCAQLKSITFSKNLKVLGEGAFMNCVALSSINFAATAPAEFNALPAYAFSGCSALTSVTIPGYFKTIGKGAFYNCSGIKTLVLSEGVETVGKQAFQGTVALEALTLPASFNNDPTPLEDLAFAGSTVLKRSGITCNGAKATAYANEMILAEE